MAPLYFWKALPMCYPTYSHSYVSYQGSTALTFIDDYNSLTGGRSYKDLVNVVVGKNSA
ncbi:ribosome-inactivating protein 3-like [Panicum miliaceum]|uniref:Ribosome-inactivating protein 3-like n=1 Tax=Panicum miliaceum TaxID=4540 RepID=A0A3L6Q036_PANMI|nr:ribosome-inactivating protein 3-like [Panicum miliaceum]